MTLLLQVLHPFVPQPTIPHASTQRRQILSTVGVVFVTFLLRAVFAVMFAAADSLQNDDGYDSTTCLTGNRQFDLCDRTCYNSWTSMQVKDAQKNKLCRAPALSLALSMTLRVQAWLEFTPEFNLLVVLMCVCSIANRLPP